MQQSRLPIKAELSKASVVKVVNDAFQHSDESVLVGFKGNVPRSIPMGVPA
jgi:hypothetical protein